MIRDTEDAKNAVNEAFTGIDSGEIAAVWKDCVRNESWRGAPARPPAAAGVTAGINPG